jgi:hypothetical protein
VQIVIANITGEKESELDTARPIDRTKAIVILHTHSGTWFKYFSAKIFRRSS